MGQARSANLPSDDLVKQQGDKQFQTGEDFDPGELAGAIHDDLRICLSAASKRHLASNDLLYPSGRGNDSGTIFWLHAFFGDGGFSIASYGRVRFSCG